MKLINRGASNTLVFTLSEKQTLTSPYFLFRFINKITNESNTCIASDTSSYTYRYNQFVITESGSENRTAGTLELRPTGEWIYEVYEQSSASNLDFAAAGSLLETGMVRVIGTDTTNYRHTKDNTNKVYGTGS
jgi:hypothetical protein